jgi:hypothetical protein
MTRHVLDSVLIIFVSNSGRSLVELPTKVTLQDLRAGSVSRKKRILFIFRTTHHPSSVINSKTISNMLFTKAWTTLSRAATGRRAMSTDGAGAGGGLVAAVGTTFVTYMTADFLSNFLQHPTQLVSVKYN